jgi:protein-S-isoprenylcysteine O-methyltransferase Ste14
MIVTPLEIAAWIELGICWVLWAMAFVQPRRRAAGQKKAVRDRSSLIGIAFVGLGFACIWTFVLPQGFQKSTISLIASMLVGPPSVVLAWMATRHLDKQWRFEAALSEDHELITTGPYRWVRHPIYASILGMLLATGLSKTWWPLFLTGILFAIIGTEIRVRAEDRLLAARFGERHARFKEETKAYIPLVR